MKKNMSKMLLVLGAAFMMSTAIISCKSKVSDADVKAGVETAITAKPELSGLVVDVKDGVATITGEVKDDAAKAAVDALKDVKGVKSVVNSTTIAPPPAPIEVSADATLTTSVKDALKDNAGITATVADGVVTLTGDVKKADLAKVMQKVNALKPKKVENKLTVK